MVSWFYGLPVEVEGSLKCWGKIQTALFLIKHNPFYIFKKIYIEYWEHLVNLNIKGPACDVEMDPLA